MYLDEHLELEAHIWRATQHNSEKLNNDFNLWKSEIEQSREGSTPPSQISNLKPIVNPLEIQWKYHKKSVEKGAFPPGACVPEFVYHLEMFWEVFQAVS